MGDNCLDAHRVLGGSSLAITLVLNACPYRAIASFHARSQSPKFYWGGNYCDAAGTLLEETQDVAPSNAFALPVLL